MYSFPLTSFLRPLSAKSIHGSSFLWATFPTRHLLSIQPVFHLFLFSWQFSLLELLSLDFCISFDSLFLTSLCLDVFFLSWHFFLMAFFVLWFSVQPLPALLLLTRLAQRTSQYKCVGCKVTAAPKCTYFKPLGLGKSCGIYGAFCPWSEGALPIKYCSQNLLGICLESNSILQCRAALSYPRGAWA